MDNLFISDYYNDRVREITGPITSVKQILNKPDISMYPNPVKSILNIELTGIGLSSDSKITLLDITGREVLSLEKNISADDYFSVDVSGLSAGMYFIKIDMGDTPIISKFIKQ